jgi:biotin synthase
LRKSEIVNLLCGNESSDEELFRWARTARTKRFANRVIVRGVIELTNKCRVNCDFCPMRRDNQAPNFSYSLNDHEIISTASAIRAAGLNVVLVQGGEIPQTTNILERVIPRILELFDGNVEILLNLGNKKREEYVRLKKAGATSYILKHETSDSALYRKLKSEPLEERLRCMSDLLDLGFKVGTGSIIGLPGQSIDSIADDILLAQKMGVQMASASPFVAALNTPLSGHEPGSVLLTLRTIAVTRLVLPHALIPSVSALEVYRSGAQGAGLRAGANVMTVNFTPRESRTKYLIYGSKRYIVTLDYVQSILREHDLEMSGSLWISPLVPKML